MQCFFFAELTILHHFDTIGIVLLIFGGISLIINAGSSDSKKAAQAQQTVSSALIGFAVVFSAYFIIQIISLITGVKILDSGL